MDIELNKKIIGPVMLGIVGVVAVVAYFKGVSLPWALYLGCMVLALLVIISGKVFMILAAFKRNFVWGIAYIVLPFVGLYLIVVDSEVRRGAFVVLSGVALVWMNLLVAELLEHGDAFVLLPNHAVPSAQPDASKVLVPSDAKPRANSMAVVDTSVLDELKPASMMGKGSREVVKLIGRPEQVLNINGKKKWYYKNRALIFEKGRVKKEEFF